MVVHGTQSSDMNFIRIWWRVVINRRTSSRTNYVFNLLATLIYSKAGLNTFLTRRCYFFGRMYLRVVVYLGSDGVNVNWGSCKRVIRRKLFVWTALLEFVISTIPYLWRALDSTISRIRSPPLTGCRMVLM